MLDVVREVQIPLLAALLIGGCAAKARRAISERSIEAGTGPTAMFPLRLRRPVAIAMCASELALGIGLIVTAGSFGAGRLALAVRLATALLFCTAVGALNELRARNPAQRVNPTYTLLRFDDLPMRKYCDPVQAGQAT